VHLTLDQENRHLWNYIPSHVISLGYNDMYCLALQTCKILTNFTLGVYCFTYRFVSSTIKPRISLSKNWSRKSLGCGKAWSLRCGPAVAVKEGAAGAAPVVGETACQGRVLVEGPFPPPLPPPSPTSSSHLSMASLSSSTTSSSTSCSPLFCLSSLSLSPSASPPSASPPSASPPSASPTLLLPLLCFHVVHL